MRVGGFEAGARNSEVFGSEFCYVYMSISKIPYYKHHHLSTCLFSHLCSSVCWHVKFYSPPDPLQPPYVGGRKGKQAESPER